MCESALSRPTDSRICILSATATIRTFLTTLFAQKVMPPIISLTSHRRTQNRVKNHFFPVEAEGETFLSRTATADETWVHHFETLRLRRHLFAETEKKPRRINGSQMRFKSGRFRVIRVEHWPYTCLLDNSCLFVRVLTLSRPHYVETVAYRKFNQNLVYWTVGTITETKTF
jgi:hypothetical protein